ncbi:helix-turn-helix domain-containing protein [Leekyejoonella antrihumi]|uniref:helix-turn-helix domain-containing protein n=1 Tax=Leekyejoonella antrihumi TaxID=1660198 RepID=UPI001649286B|nr:AraC family transcriptional regulator [Leekyejoonella antrihumi]
MAETCVYQRFDTRLVSPQDRFAFWRTWYDEAVDVRMRLDPLGSTITSPAGFAASAYALTAGDLQVVEVTSGPAAGTWARSATEVKDLLRLILLAPSPAGVAAWHRYRLHLEHGAVAVLGRTAGAWHTPAGMHGIQVNVARSALALSDAQIDTVLDRGPLQVTPVLACLARPALAAMAGRLQTFAGAEAFGMRDTWVAMMRMLLRAMIDRDLCGTDLAAARRVAIDQCIRANLADPRLNPDQIAAVLHISRRTLYAAFPTDDRGSPGHGVAARIRQQRMDVATTLLTDPVERRPVHVVATMVGLPDPAHFSRLFHAAFGCSPREYQHRASATNERQNAVGWT